MKKLIEKDVFLRMLKRIAHEIIEQNDNLNDIIFLGIERKGTPIAKELANLIYTFEGTKIDVYPINIDKHRDDNKKDVTVSPALDVDITNKTIILVDDVLFTGRSVRAAMDAVMDFGRPKRISLVVLVDRGHRELPIRADYVGKNLPTSHDEHVICDFDAKEIYIKN